MNCKRIFIGFSEVANFINAYRIGFESLGYKTFTVVGFRNKYYPHAHYDIVLSERNKWFRQTPGIIGRILRSLLARFTMARVFFIALLKCQVFYYNTGGNALPFRLDYFLIKLFRKKLVIVFLGSEIRHWFLYKKDLEEFGYDQLFASCIEAYRLQNFGNLTQKRERVASAETYADMILSQPGFAQLQTKPYNRVTVGLYLPDYNFMIPARKRPLIVHAPSSRGIKGTEFVEEALEKLAAEGVEFDFRLIENLPNRDLVELLVESDIVIDELNSDTIGVLSTEAMATGNAVLTSYMADFVKVPLPCPVQNTNRLTIYENLKLLILDIEFRCKLAKQGRVYVEKHHDIRKIAESQLAWLYFDEKKYDFYPHFNAKKSLPFDVLNVEKRKI